MSALEQWNRLTGRYMEEYHVGTIEAFDAINAKYPGLWQEAPRA